MAPKPKYQTYYCKHCETMEYIPENQDKIKLSQITAVYCSMCAAQGKQRKMRKVKE